MVFCIYAKLTNYLSQVVYSFDQDTLSIFTAVGTKKCEAAYEISKCMYFDDPEVKRENKTILIIDLANVKQFLSLQYYMVP